ncbi:MAG: exo-alpha-sialidase [Pirellulaceae bacterium]|nr:exo-alpha-sialidase [Pirellulaceae bacterium]
MQRFWFLAVIGLCVALALNGRPVENGAGTLGPLLGEKDRGGDRRTGVAWRGHELDSIATTECLTQVSKVVTFPQNREPTVSPASDAATDVPSPQETFSFEQSPAGEFTKLATPIGLWTTSAGVTAVDDKHAKTGMRCLQLKGGQKTSVTLQLAEHVDTSGELVFWAERWTSRAPFAFRIEKNDGQQWKEIFNGDRSVLVGREFRSQVKVPLGDSNIRALRFTVTSPANTGVLIDDIRFTSPVPQQILSVDVVPMTLPALVGAEFSPLLRLKIETQGSLSPISLTEVSGSLLGAAGMFSLQIDRDDPHQQQALTLPSPPNRTEDWQIEPWQLRDGDNVITIGCQLKENANIDSRVGMKLDHLRFSDGQTVKLEGPPTVQRMGVALRNAGADGVHTYRIPGLVTTEEGTLIAVYDIRRRSGGDLPGDIDVGMSRSRDGGQTWEPMQVIMDMGDDPAWQYDGVGDPAVMVDRNTGTVWVAATWSHGNRSWRGSGPGLDPQQTGQLMLVRSDDDGVTWSQPINITEQVKRPEWSFILQGPGKGITMRDGTLVFAAQYQDPPDKQRLPHSTIIFSKDHGKTWQVGTAAFDDTTEAQVVEIEPGVLMLNCRYNRKSTRVVMTTNDMGETWQKHTTSERALIEPRSCMASLIDVDQETGKDGGGWLLFSNPDSTRGRNHLTIKASPDGGLTWPKAHRLLLDEGNSAGYSCLSMIDERTVGILYEGSRAHMTFQRIPLGDLIANGAPPREDELAPQQALALPQVFGNHMVLQANSELPIWGNARAGDWVTITLGDVVRKAHADEAGEWSVRLPSRPADAAPLTLTIQSGGKEIQFENVLIGEVWVCAGQSNMEWPLRKSENANAVLSSANHPSIRLLHLAGGAGGNASRYDDQQIKRLRPEAFCEGKWAVATAESAQDFSAVAWYFGRHLQQRLDVPVGLIHLAVGGTPAEAWISKAAIQADADLVGMVAGNWLDNPRLGDFCRTRGLQNLLPAIQAGEYIPGTVDGPHHPFQPGFMWDAGVAPLIPYAIRGVIWYQGESNAETLERVRQHRRLFPMLICHWRAAWHQGDFPFLYVQLPAMNRPQWPAFRETQRRVLGQLENVGMAISIDLGDATNVHPPGKEPVGQRLARWALGNTYGISETIVSGPLLEKVVPDGQQLVLTFQHSGEGLSSSDGKACRHFEVCGEDGIFRSATARVIGRDRITVSCGELTTPRYVRYAWRPYPEPGVNLVNSEGLPASPFSTEPADEIFSIETRAEQP